MFLNYKEGISFWHSSAIHSNQGQQVFETMPIAIEHMPTYILLPFRHISLRLWMHIPHLVKDYREKRRLDRIWEKFQDLPRLRKLEVYFIDSRPSFRLENSEEGSQTDEDFTGCLEPMKMLSAVRAVTVYFRRTAITAQLEAKKDAYGLHNVTFRNE